MKSFSDITANWPGLPGTKNAITFKLPFDFRFKDNSQLRDCTAFRVFFHDQLDTSVDLSTRSLKFQDGISSRLFKDSVQTNKMCLETCCLAPKQEHDVYIQLNILNRAWSSNYTDVSTQESKFLKSEIQTMITSKISVDLKCYRVIDFGLVWIRSVQASTTKRAFASSTILVTCRLKLDNPNSGPATRQSIAGTVQALMNDPGQSIKFNNAAVTDVLPPEPTTTTVATATAENAQSKFNFFFHC